MDELEKGILPLLMGGLGNQMFIVSAGYIAHRVSNAPLYLLQNSVKNNDHNLKRRNYNRSIFKYIGQHLPFTSEAKYFIESLDYQEYCQGCEYNTTDMIDADHPHKKWDPANITPGTIMQHSYFQYYPPLKPFENDLRELYIKGLEEFRKDLKDYSDYAFLHIRRGDYLKEGYPIPTAEYYATGVSTLKRKGVQKYVVLSDDIPWVKEQEYFKDPKFEIFESDDELLAMALMSKCTAGAICANSTFSWWGAFLGAHGVRAPVIVPKEWVRNRDLPDLCPEEWIRI